AGFDTLSLRLAAEHDDVTFVEVDHPATQEAKARALEGETLASRIELLPVDFTEQTLRQRLPEARTLDLDRRTVAICEGVPPYLEVDEAHALFASLRDLFGSGTTVIFTFIAERSPSGRQPHGPLLRVMLLVWGEHMKLRIEPDAVRTLVEGEGFVADTITETSALLEHYRAPDYRGDLHDLEMHAVARVP
ncbi:MAG: class I SAM-dependent methyltransferase, partial [Myxococcota bacterium]